MNERLTWKINSSGEVRKETGNYYSLLLWRTNNYSAKLILLWFHILQQLREKNRTKSKKYTWWYYLIMNWDWFRYQRTLRLNKHKGFLYTFSQINQTIQETTTSVGTTVTYRPKSEMKSQFLFLLKHTSLNYKKQPGNWLFHSSNPSWLARRACPRPSQPSEDDLRLPCYYTQM